MSSNEEPKEEDEVTAEESAEFRDTLKSLETTMKLHMTTLSAKRGLAPLDGGGGPGVVGLNAPVPPPRSLSRLRREGSKVNGVLMPSRKDKVRTELFIRWSIFLNQLWTRYNYDCILIPD